MNQQSIKITSNKLVEIDLRQENKELKQNIEKINRRNDIFDALVKLHECNVLVNKEFKRLYRIQFNLRKYDNNIPNIGDFIFSPPSKEDDEENYNFWIEFNNQYPNSNNEEFRKIYQQISNNREDAGAYINVSKLSKDEFDNLIKLVYPNEYESNKELYNNYRDWLFMFPV